MISNEYKQDWLHNFQDPLQNEDVGALFTIIKDFKAGTEKH